MACDLRSRGHDRALYVSSSFVDVDDANRLLVCREMRAPWKL